MKILIVSSYYKPAYIYGGTTTVISILGEILEMIGHEVVVFTTNANGKHNFVDILPNTVVAQAPKVHYFNRLKYFPPRYFYAPALGRACQDEIKNFDVVYIMGTWTYPFLPAASNSYKNRVPYVIGPHGNLMEWAIKSKRAKKYLYHIMFERKLINHCSYIHCTSQQEMIQTKKMGFKPPLVVIPNPIQIERFAKKQNKGRLRHHLGIPNDASVTLFVGRLNQVKRIDLIINQFSRVLKNLPDAHLLLVGADEDGTESVCKELAYNLGLQRNIHFTGLLQGDDLLQAYADSDLFILISKGENFGMAAAEAMVAGLPIIVGKEVGISSFIQNSEVGRIVDANSDGLVEIWSEIAISPGMRETMGVNARNFASRLFSSESVAQQMSELFVQAMEHNRR